MLLLSGQATRTGRHGGAAVLQRGRAATQGPGAQRSATPQSRELPAAGSCGVPAPATLALHPPGTRQEGRKSPRTTTGHIPPGLIVIPRLYSFQQQEAAAFQFQMPSLSPLQALASKANIAQHRPHPTRTNSKHKNLTSSSRRLRRSSSIGRHHSPIFKRSPGGRRIPRTRQISSKRLGDESLV